MCGKHLQRCTPARRLHNLTETNCTAHEKDVRLVEHAEVRAQHGQEDEQRTATARGVILLRRAEERRHCENEANFG